MGLYFGTSCLNRDWHCVAVDQHGERQDERVQPLGVDTDANKGGLLGSLEELTYLTQQSLSNEDGQLRIFEEVSVGRELGRKIQALNAGWYLAEFTEYLTGESITSNPLTVCVCHPFGTSPTLRRALPSLFDHDPITLDRRRGQSAAYEQLNSRGRACAIELPFAVALELLSARSDSLPASVFTANGHRIGVVSAGCSAYEFTTLCIRQSADEFVVSIESFTAIDSKANISYDLYHRLMAGSQRLLTVYAIGETEAVSTVVASSIQNETLVDVKVESFPESFVASGAAQYAALCDEILSSIPLPVRFETLAAWPVGVIGRGPKVDDGIYWLPLWEQHARLDGKPLSIRHRGEPPSLLILAECTSANRIPGEVMSGVEHLRWHSQVRVNTHSTGESTPESIEIALQPSIGCLNYGWSDPFVQATVV